MIDWQARVNEHMGMIAKQRLIIIDLKSENARLHAKLERETPMHIVEPGKVPFPREPEPYATLKYRDIEIYLGLTYMHHLVVCRGWGDKESSYYDDDEMMHKGMGEICTLMRSEPTPDYPCDMGCGIGQGVFPRAIERDEAGNTTKYAWVCAACDRASRERLIPIESRKKNEAGR